MEKKADFRLIANLEKLSAQHELNIVGWNHGEPMFDIRNWKSGQPDLTDGVALTEAEMDALVQAYNEFKSSRNN